MNFKKYEDIASRIRIDIIKAVHKAGSGHPGGSLSAADIVTALYFKVMNIDPENPRMEGRDKFILSKGHAGPVQYAALAERGYYDVEEMMSLRKLGSHFQGHPNRDKVPGIEMSTGSLGQGFAVAVGMAMAGKMDDKIRQNSTNPDAAPNTAAPAACECGASPADQTAATGRVYVLLGDGELQEGLVWEAAMAAAHYKLDNLCAIVDWNGLQIDGKNEDVMTVAPIDEKFKAFGFNVLMIDGHNFEEIFAAFDKAAECKGKPTVIIAKTNKGRGVSFMQDNPGWHGKAPNEDEAKQAVAELGGEW